jgi:hypothetical protein
VDPKEELLEEELLLEIVESVVNLRRLIVSTENSQCKTWDSYVVEICEFVLDTPPSAINMPATKFALEAGVGTCLPRLRKQPRIVVSSPSTSFCNQNSSTYLRRPQLC